MICKNLPANGVQHSVSASLFVASKHTVVSNKNIKDDDVQTEVSAESGWAAYFVENGNKMPADLIFEQAFAFWNEFILQNDVAPGHPENDSE